MVKYTYLSVNVWFLKFMGMYPVDKNYNPLFKLIYYFWRFICWFCLLTHSIQCIVDIFVRAELEFADVSANILNAGKNLHSTTKYNPVKSKPNFSCNIYTDPLKNISNFITRHKIYS